MDIRCDDLRFSLQYISIVSTSGVSKLHRIVLEKEYTNEVSYFFRHCSG